MGALDSLASLPATVVSALGGVSATVQRYTGSTHTNGATTPTYASAESVTMVVTGYTRQEIVAGFVNPGDVKGLIPGTSLAGAPVPKTKVTFGGLVWTVQSYEATYAGSSVALYTCQLRRG